MILLLLLLFLVIWVYHNTKEPPELIELKERYRILREHLKETENEKFKMLYRCIPITGVLYTNGTVGSNTNKGSEIVVCISGTINEIFHVLIHELAHCTVREYDHSDAYWKNYTELRDICVTLGIYEKIPTKTPFCGKHVQDK
jgi:hypothetical protein